MNLRPLRPELHAVLHVHVSPLLDRLMWAANDSGSAAPLLYLSAVHAVGSDPLPATVSVCRLSLLDAVRCLRPGAVARWPGSIVLA